MWHQWHCGSQSSEMSWDHAMRRKQCESASESVGQSGDHFQFVPHHFTLVVTNQAQQCVFPTHNPRLFVHLFDYQEWFLDISPDLNSQTSRELTGTHVVATATDVNQALNQNPFFPLLNDEQLMRWFSTYFNLRWVTPPFGTVRPSACCFIGTIIAKAKKAHSDAKKGTATSSWSHRSIQRCPVESTNEPIKSSSSSIAHYLFTLWNSWVAGVIVIIKLTYCRHDDGCCHFPPMGVVMSSYYTPSVDSGGDQLIIIDGGN